MSNQQNQKSLIILLSCPDRMGIVARVSNFIFDNFGNILNLEQHVDDNTKELFMRVECSLCKLNGNTPNKDSIKDKLQPIADEFSADISIQLNGHEKPKTAIFVSKHLHCLLDLLWRHKIGELNCDIPLIISNHLEAESIASNFDIPYHHIAITKENKAEQETKQIELLKEHNIDLVVMARYMQILSEDFINEYSHKIINIHHSFLPAFIGGNPYKQALERGVKIIGATSHYATADLDEGPIIEQDIIRISHKDSLEELKSKGRDLEEVVLARAVKAHLESRILISGRKTIVFES